MEWGKQGRQGTKANLIALMEEIQDGIGKDNSRRWEWDDVEGLKDMTLRQAVLLRLFPLKKKGGWCLKDLH